MDSNCVFCKIIKGEIPSQQIYENDDVLVIISLQGHPMVITKKHIENIYDLDEKSAEEVMKAAVKVSKAVKKGLNADGINLLQNNEEAAGQEVMHFHMHIKPRFKSDNELKTVDIEKIKSALD